MFGRRRKEKRRKEKNNPPVHSAKWLNVPWARNGNLKVAALIYLEPCNIWRCIQGWGYSLVEEDVLTVFEALGSILPSPSPPTPAKEVSLSMSTSTAAMKITMRTRRGCQDSVKWWHAQSRGSVLGAALLSCVTSLMSLGFRVLIHLAWTHEYECEFEDPLPVPASRSCCNIYCC